MNDKEFFEYEKKRSLEKIAKTFEEVKKLYNALAMSYYCVAGAENEEELEKELKWLNDKTNHFEHIFWR